MNFSSSPGSDTFTATSITFTNPGSAIAPINGQFAVFLGGSVVFSPTLWNTASGTETATVTAGVNTDIIKITSFTFDAANTLSSMTVRGSGTSQINGGALVPISIILTSQDPNGQGGGTTGVSYSATINTVVPLPGALVLFGSGLVGLAALGRRRQKQKQLAAA
jgi:hypothetical protein